MKIELQIESILNDYQEIEAFAIVIVREGIRMEVDYIYQPNIGLARYKLDTWKWFLNANGIIEQNKPVIEDYNTDPVRVCHECGHHYSIYSNKIKCNCIPY